LLKITFDGGAVSRTETTTLTATSVARWRATCPGGVAINVAGDKRAQRPVQQHRDDVMKSFAVVADCRPTVLGRTTGGEERDTLGSRRSLLTSRMQVGPDARRLRSPISEGTVIPIEFTSELERPRWPHENTTA